MRIALFLLSVAVAGLSAACNPSSASPAAVQSRSSAAPAPPPAGIATAIAALAANEKADAVRVLDARMRRQLRAMYEARAWAPLWTTGDGEPMPAVDAVLARLRRASDEGLDPWAYRAAELSREARALADTRPSDARAAGFDVAVTAVTAAYLHDLHVGRVDPRAIGFHMSAPPDEHDFPALVGRAAAEGRLAAAAEDLTPTLGVYRALRTALARYRALADDDSIAAPPPARASVRPGEAYAGVAALHRLLVAVGDLPADTPSPGDGALYQGAVVEGVARFQARHGLEPDGVLGRGTQQALGVPLRQRVRQIELALERLRWLPHLKPGRLLAVNIPMFQVWGLDSTTPGTVPAFESRVIVGRALDTETPVFVDEMQEVIFRPYWNVPPSILRNEILPAIARNSGYLAREDMEIVDGQGDDARPVRQTPASLAELAQGRLRVRQRPGPDNALGLVKFVFPNDDNIYMHGTPAMQLFARARRDFSHGCIRVEGADALAAWVLKTDPTWSTERITAAMQGASQLRVPLTEPIQVVLFYITAAVLPQDGAVHFAADIYRHDARLDQALARLAAR